MGKTHNKMVKDKNIRDAGLKVTLPRVRILEIFESSDQKHLSADEVYKKLIEAGDEVGLATVYRVLTQFESADILMKHNFESGHSVYELMPDDQIIPKGQQIGLMIFSSDKEFTLWPEPGTELTVDLDGTVLTLPVVGGKL